MNTKLDIRQSETRILQDQLNLNSTQLMDSTLASINSEVTPPGRLIAQATPSLVVSVNSGTVVNPNTSKNRVLPFVSSILTDFTAGTITFPSTSGNVVASPGNTAAIVIGPNQFVAVLVQLTSSSNLAITVGTAAGSLATVGVPGESPSSLSLGYIIVQSNGAGVIQPITDANLYQFVGNSVGNTTVNKAYPNVFLSPAGNGDVTTLNGALALLPATGGVILLMDPISLTGPDATVNMPNNVLLLGRDQNATLTVISSTNFNITGAQVILKDLWFLDASGGTNTVMVNVLGGAFGFTVDHCQFQMIAADAGHIGIDFNSGVFGAWVDNCTFTGVLAPSLANAIRVQAGASDIVIGANNIYTT